MSRKPAVMVLGSSGNVGMATLQTLTSQYSGKVDIIAGVRNPDKADKLKEIKGITVVQATMGDENLPDTLKGVDRVFIIMPPTSNRLEICKATAIAAQAAEVKQMLFLSGLTAEAKGTNLGRRLLEVESSMKELSNLQLSIIRVPFFLENYFAHAYTIKKDSCVYSPVDPSKPFVTVAVHDIGRAAAAILADFERHSGKTYRMISNQQTLNEFCDEMSAQLGRSVKYVRQSYEDAEKGFQQMGFAKDLIDSMKETNKLIDGGAFSYEVSELNHYKEITGTDPITLHNWVASMKGAFQ